METFLITNAVNSLRFVEVNGRQFAIAPITILRSRVLQGSKGALYYPADENKKVAEQWNGKPLVATTHPRSNGRNISANTPEIFENQEIGRFYKSKVDNVGTNTGEGWFDVELTKRHDSRIWNALVNKQKIEVSTGLYTDDDDAPENSSYDGVKYTHIAKNYRPDHIAILVDEKGACSVSDGCGVYNSSKEQITNPKWVKDESTWERAKEQASKEDKGSDYAYITGIYKQMGGQVSNEAQITCEHCGTVQDMPDDAVCPHCHNTILTIPNTKDVIMNERNNIINWLTTNCNCYKGKKSDLDKLTDNALKEVLLENAEKATENDADQSFLDWCGNADKEIKNAFVSLIRNKIKGAVGAVKDNALPPKKKEAPAQPNDEYSDLGASPEDEMKKKQAMMQTNAQPTKPKSMDEFLKEYPFLASLVANHQTNENNEKQQLIGRITAQITDNTAKQQAIQSLASKSLDDLRLFASLSQQIQPAVNNQTTIPFAQPVANFFGAAGTSGDITDNSYLQKEQLTCNTPDWTDWAKNTSIYDNAKAG